MHNASNKKSKSKPTGNFSTQASSQGIGCTKKDESYLQLTKQFEIFFEKGLFDQAWEEVERLDKTGSLRLFTVHNLRGVLCSALRRFADAEVYFSEAERLASNVEDKARVYNNRSAMAIEQRNYKNGIEFTRKTLSLLPTNSIAWVNLLICLGQLGEEQEILIALSNMLKICDLDKQALLRKDLKQGPLLEPVRSHPFFISNILPLLTQKED